VRQWAQYRRPRGPFKDVGRPGRRALKTAVPATITRSTTGEPGAGGSWSGDRRVVRGRSFRPSRTGGDTSSTGANLRILAGNDFHRHSRGSSSSRVDPGQDRQRQRPGLPDLVDLRHVPAAHLDHPRLHAATLQPTRQAMRADGYLPCPWCKEMIRSDASVCRYCGRDFADVTDYTGQ